MPMVMITGQKAIMTARQARFQIVDIVATMKPLTKSSRQIVSAASIPTLVREAFRVAQEERPGPVHSSCRRTSRARSRRRRATRAAAPDRPSGRASGGHRARGGDDPRGQAAAGHDRGGGKPPRLDPGLTAFVHRIGIPFFNTQMGKGVVAGGTNLWMGTAALSERDYVHEAIDKADLIITIGHDTVEKPPFIMGPAGPKVIHIGYTPAEVEQVYFPACRGDRRRRPAALELLADRLDGKLPNAAALLPLRERILQQRRSTARTRTASRRPRSGSCTTCAR